MFMSGSMGVSPYATVSFEYNFPGDGEVKNQKGVPSVKAVGNLVLEKVGGENNYTVASSEQGSITATESYISRYSAKGKVEFRKCVVWSNYSYESNALTIVASESLFRMSLNAHRDIELKNSWVNQSSTFNSKSGSIVWENDDQYPWDKKLEHYAGKIQAFGDISLRNVQVKERVQSETGNITALFVNGTSSSLVNDPPCDVAAQNDIIVENSS